MLILTLGKIINDMTSRMAIEISKKKDVSTEQIIKRDSRPDF